MDLRELLAEIDRLKAEIDGLRPIDPVQERRIMQKFRLDWTYHSNAIEGNTLTYGETKAFLLHGVTAQGKPFRDYLEVKGHHEAIDYLLEFVRQQQPQTASGSPLTEAVIRELHKMILVEPHEVNAMTADGRATRRRVVPGQYKTTPNHVVTSTGEMHYYATPEETPAKMGDLMAWYRRETDKADLHPLVLAATFHYQFVTIHPFDDGNGRMARLLMNLIFMQYGYPPAIIPTNQKEAYLLALEIADADNNLHPFIEHVGKALLHSLDLFLRGARGESIDELNDLDKRLAILQKKIEAQEEEFGPARNPRTLLELNEEVIKPFLDLFLPQLAKFGSLFFQSSVALKIDKWAASAPKVEQLEIYKSLENHLGQRDVDRIIIDHEWSIFKADPNFSLSSSLIFELKEQGFSLLHLAAPMLLQDKNISQFSATRILKERRYDRWLSPNELEELVNLVTESLLGLMEQKANK